MDNTPKLFTITKEGFRYAQVFEHTDGLFTINIGLSNGYQLRLTTGGEAKLAGFREDGQFISGDLTVEDGAVI